METRPLSQVPVLRRAASALLRSRSALRRSTAALGGLLAALVLTAPSALAAPGVTQLGTAATSSNFNTKTLANFTVPAGTNRLLVVTASDSVSLDVTSATFNGTPMTQAVERNDGIAVDSIWYLPMGSSASSTTGNVVIATSGGGDRQTIGAIVFQSVDQTTPVSGAISHQAGSGAVNQTVTSRTGDLVFDLFDVFSFAALPTVTPGAGQTQVYTAGGALLDGYGKYAASTKLGAASVSTSWTQNGESLLYLALNIRLAAASQTFTVNSTLHGTDADSGTTTLVEAINAANTAGGSNTIELPATTAFTPDDAVFIDSTENTGRTLYPRITSNVTINGNGSTLDATSKNARFFVVGPGASLAVNDLNLVSGKAKGGDGGAGNPNGGGGGAGMGGAIFVNGATASLTMKCCTVMGCAATGGNGGSLVGVPGAGGGGGGLGGAGATSGGGGPRSAASGNTGGDGIGGNANASGTFGGGGGGGTTTGAAGSGGFGGGGGGALCGPPHGSPGAGGFGAGGGAVSGGTSGTTGGAGGTFGGYGQRYIVSGFANGGGGGGLGGAIFNYSGSVTLENVSLLTNSANGANGSYNDPASGADGQRAGAGSGVGGAIFNYDGTVSLKHVTASGNIVMTGATTPGTATGGVLYNYDAPAGSTPAVTIYNSILANSTFTNASGADVANSGSGTIAASGAANSNLLETTSGTVTGTFLTVDPQLSLTGRYSGKLLILPFAGSPVLNAGDAANSLATDARGSTRPEGAGVDLGAAEGALSTSFTLAAGSLLVCDTNADAVFAVDPATGNRTLVSKLNVVGTGPDIGNPRGIVADATGANAYVVDTTLRAVVKVDLTNGNRTVISTGTGTAVGTGAAFNIPSGIARRADGKLLVSDTGGLNGTAGSDAVIVVDPATGNRTILTDDVTPSTTNALSTPSSILNHSTLGVLVADSTTTDTITLVNPTTGARTIFSSNTVPNGTNPITNPQGLAEDTDGSILLIEQNTAALANRQLLRLDKTTGARTVVSNLATADTYEGVAVAPSGVYVTRTATADRIFKVNTSTGATTVAADNTVGDGILFGAPNGSGVMTIGFNLGLAVVPTASAGTVTTFDSLPTALMLGNADTTAPGATVTNIEGWDFNAISPTGLRTNFDVWDGAVGTSQGVAISATSGGGADYSSITVKHNDDYRFDLRSVGLNMQMVNGGSVVSGRSVTLIGVNAAGAPISGATLTSVVNDTLLVAFDVSSNANFQGVAGFRVVPVTAGDVIGYIFIDSIDATNFTAPPANSAPTDLALSANSINQTAATAGASIGTLSSTDSDSGDTFTYTLVSGTGATDNASFAISGATLQIGGTPLTAGSYSVRVRTTDAGLLTYEGAFTVTVADNLAPLVASVNSSTANGTYKTGDTVSIQVNFSEAVAVTGTPTLALNSGGTASYASGSGTSTLTFSYTVGAGEASADLDYTSTNALALSGGTIRDAATNAATLTLASPGAANSLGANKSLVVDGVVPTVASVNSSTTNATYKTGDTISVQANFSEAVTVTGTPQLTLETGTTDRVVNYASGSGTSTLTFTYTVQAGDTSADLDYQSTNALALNGGTIRDAATNAATLTLAAPGAANSLGANKALVIDGVVPAVNSVSVPSNATYIAGQNLDFTANFSEGVTVNTGGGTPTIGVTLDTGGTVQAAYVSGSGTSALTFRYTVASGNLDGNGVSVAASITANGGAIRDAAGNNATLTLNSVGSTTAVLVDAVAPSVSSINRVTAASSNAASVDYTVTFSESVSDVDTADFTLTTTGTVAGTIASLTGSGTTYTVTVNAITGDGTVRLDLKSSGTGIADVAGNAIGSGFTAGQVYTFDHSAPTVASVGVPANGTYVAGQNLDLMVNFTEAATVSGTPRIAVSLDTGGTVFASYTSGSGTTALVFRYTVAAGNLDANGITVGALGLNGGTITDAATNNATLTLNSVGSTAGVLVDAIVPTVASVAVPANATYANGQNLDFTVSFSEAVTLNTGGGTPAIVVTLDTGGTVNASYLSGSGSSALTFRYTIATGNLDATGIALGASIAANGGTLRDAAGNDAALTLNAVGATAAVLVDAVAPSVSSIARQTPAGAGTNSTSVSYRVTFSESVSSVDASDFSLTATGTSAGSVASIASVSGSVYDVTVTTITGTGTLRLDLKASATGIADLPGNAITAAFTAGQTYTIDTDAPTVASVAVPANGSYVAGQNLDFTVNLSEAATVTGTPRLAVTVDTGGTVFASYLSGNGTSALTFRYTVATGDLDPNGVTVGAALQLNGGTIQDAATNNAVLALNSVGSTAGVLVDAVAPSVAAVSAPANRTYKIGDHLDFIATFSEAVTVNAGTPSLAVTLDTGAVSAGYVAGSGTNTLVFRYTIASGDLDANGVALGAAIATNGATIRDAAGNDVALALTNVSATSAVLVDGVVPTVMSIARGGNSNTNASSVDYTVTFSESVTGVGTADFVVARTGTANATIASIAAVNGSTYTVTLSTVTGDGTLRLDLAASGTDIADLAGNAITGGFTGGESYALDQTAPTIGSVNIPASKTYVSGDHLDFTIQFDEATTVETTGGSPFLPLTLDTGGAVEATYLSGSGTSALVFRYTVVTGNLDLTGIALGGSITTNGGTLKDSVGNDVARTLNGLPSTAGILVDAIAPTVASVSAPANNTYAAGQALDFTVTYAEAVNVSGAPFLPISLATGGAAQAVYVSGSGSGTLTFRYTVRSGDEDADGLGVGQGIALNGGTIRDLGGNDADLATPAFNTAGVLIDGRAPTVGSIVRQTPTTSATSLASVTYRVTFSEKVTGVGGSAFALTTTGTAGGSIGSVSAVSDTEYDVTVNSLVRGGTIRLDLQSNSGIADAVSNPLTAAFTGGETFNLVANRAPSFTAGGDVSVAQNAGVVSRPGWATAISAGAPDEEGQALTFTLTADNVALFAAPPTLAPNGTLLIVPAAQASGTATVTVTLKDDGGTADGGADTSAPITFKIAVTTYKEETGTYNGLVQAAPDTTPSNDRVGVIRVNVTKKGTFTGTLNLAGARFTLKGFVNEGGVVTFGKLKTANLPLVRKGKTTLALALQLDVGAGTDKLLGTLTDLGAPFAVVEADRFLYVRKAKPVAPYLNVPPALVGRYTVVFAAQSPGAEQRSAAEFPQGDGVGLLTVTKAGTARLRGTLADGTAVTCANALSKDNRWPLYAVFAKGAGSISAPLSFREVAEVSDLDATGALWFKPAAEASARYAEGWAGGLRVNLLGSKFVIPKSSAKTSIFTGLEVPDAGGNATAIFADGNLPVEGITSAINVSARNVVTVIDKDEAKLTMTMLFPWERDYGQEHRTGLFANGMFTGSFLHPVTGTRAAFKGVIFQKQKMGFGFFLCPTESGSVVLEPQGK